MWKRLLTVAFLGGLVAMVAASPSYAADQSAGHSSTLLVRYATQSTCTIVPNYPKSGVVGNAARTWTIAAGQKIIWRYNVNSTWAAVSDPARAAAKQFPWWGFTQSGCIGKSVKQSGYPAGQPVPERILEGRSQQASGWRSVDFSVTPAAVTASHREIHCNATLRDPANFVTGNVFPGWHVDVTGRTRSNGYWVEVYVPNAKRWAYVQSSVLTTHC